MNLTKIFPELNEIKDTGLREKTEKALAKAIKLSGWTEENLDIIPFTLLIPEIVGEDNKPMINLIHHLRAVTQLSMATYDQYVSFGLGDKLNRDELISAGLLHDVGKFVEYEFDNEQKIIQTLFSHKIDGHTA